VEVQPLLAGKRVLVTGILTRHSIAFNVAQRVQELGGEVVATGFGRTRRLTERALQGLPQPLEPLELDVNSERDLQALADRLGGRPLDGLLHAIAHAPADALGESFLATPAESAVQAFRTSAFSLKALVAALAGPLSEAPDGASVVALDFDSTVAWPGYNWMGVAKAALEAVARYLSRELGPHGVRVNLVSAGPLETPAASAIPGFEQLASLWRSGAPLGWDPADPGPVADAIVLLLSPLARGISGELLHVDGGFHAQGAPLEPAGG